MENINTQPRESGLNVINVSLRVIIISRSVATRQDTALAPSAFSLFFLFYYLFFVVAKIGLPSSILIVGFEHGSNNRIHIFRKNIYFKKILTKHVCLEVTYFRSMFVGLIF